MMTVFQAKWEPAALCTPPQCSIIKSLFSPVVEVRDVLPFKRTGMSVVFPGYLELSEISNKKEHGIWPALPVDSSLPFWDSLY